MLFLGGRRGPEEPLVVELAEFELSGVMDSGSGEGDDVTDISAKGDSQDMLVRLCLPRKLNGEFSGSSNVTYDVW